MKRLFNLWITFFTGLLTLTGVSAQTLSRFTTAELLNKVKTQGTGFITSNPEIQVNYALPLIDCTVALELARISGLQTSNNYVYAISLQCRDDSLKQMILSDVLARDNLCNDALITKNEYDQGGVAGIYEYGRLHNAMLEQIDKSDTSFLKTATKEFEFWAPMASDYIDIIMKPGMHQLAIKSGKKKFTRCMLASAANCSLWIACIYLITGKEAYGSANEQLNEVYRKLMNRLRIDKRADRRKGFIRLGKQNTVTTTAPVNTLDSLDFETIPSLKEKFDKARAKDNGQILIYTHGNKGLLFLYYSEKLTMGLSKRVFGFPSIYLTELTTPSTIQLTNIDYRDRYR